MKIRALLLAVLLPVPAWAQGVGAGEATEHVVVLGTLPSSDIGLSADKVPGTLQSFDADQLTAQQSGTILSALGSQVAGVSLSDAQGNSLFQSLRLHGFEASPLQGVAQGVAVYQNGVRLNEAFGDTVNWDAVPETAISRMDVWSSNPVFGLNALGGAVNLVMKNGFTWQGTALSAQGGSYGHALGTAQYGFTDGDFSFYGSGEFVTDSGWRPHSPSDVGRIYADAGWRAGDNELHLVASGSVSGLGVVGPTPVELLQKASNAIYTYPQTTHNLTGSIALNDQMLLRENWQLEASAYVRSFRQRHVDGNDGDFESCSSRSSYGGKLCLQDDAFGTPPGGKTTAFRDQFVIMDSAGQPFAFNSAVSYGTLDRTFTDSVTQGGTIQVTSSQPLFGLTNYFTAGGSIDHSSIAFQSASTLAREFPSLRIAPDSSVPGAGNIIHALGNIGYAPVNLGASTNYYGLYAVDTLDLYKLLTLTVGFRANAADISGRDRSGSAAELTGSHGYGRINPLVGMTFTLGDAFTLFGGYSEANRAPTPLELDCASQTQPCLLEGALVADPPLAQVVAHTFEQGARGNIGLGDGKFAWSASVFRSDSNNDIIALASTIAGRGYFTNVPSTQRIGVDLTANYFAPGWSVHASYSFLEATYQFAGALASPNNPNADDNGNVSVVPGSHIPLNPAHTLKAGADVTVMDSLSLGGELVFTGSQYFDGDPSNLDAKLPSYVVVNLRAAYDISPQWQAFGLVDNVFDNHNATYGTYFGTDNTVGLLNPALTDPHTLTLHQPITFQLGLRLKF